jgi:hypothetical protein
MVDVTRHPLHQYFSIRNTQLTTKFVGKRMVALGEHKFSKFIKIAYGPVGIRTRDSRISSLDKSPVLYLAELRAQLLYGYSSAI